MERPGCGPPWELSFQQAALQLVARHNQETSELRSEVFRLRARLDEKSTLRAASKQSGPGASPDPPSTLPCALETVDDEKAGRLNVDTDSCRPPAQQVGLAHEASIGNGGQAVVDLGRESRNSTRPSTAWSADFPALRGSRSAFRQTSPSMSMSRCGSKTSSKADARLEERDVDHLIRIRKEHQEKEDAAKSFGELQEVAMTRGYCCSIFCPTTVELGQDDRPVQVARRRIKTLISSPVFDCIIGVIILMHSVTIGFETSESVTHNRHPPFFAYLEKLFLSIYILELFMRFFATSPRQALHSHWVKFDTLMVVCGTLDQIIVLSGGSFTGLDDVMLIRILRIGRLARTARLMIQFRTLWMLVQGLMHSMLTLLWTLLIVVVLCYVFAILGMELFKDTKGATGAYDDLYVAIAQENFGTLPDAMATMFQFLTLDSVAAIYRPLVAAKPSLALYFLAFLLLVPIALMNLVTAIMVESSMKQASADQEAQRAWNAQRRKELLPELAKLFESLDADGSGDLELEELRAAEHAVKEQLMSICNWGEVEDIFNQLDYDNSGSVSIDEFCEGLLKVGSDKPVELYCIMRQCCDILHTSRQVHSILEQGQPSVPAIGA